MAYAIFKHGQPTIAGVLVDNRLSEDHSAEAEATRFPVDGADPDVTDHVILQPKTFSIDAWISNIDGNGIPATGERAKAALADLIGLRDARSLLEVVSYHLIYPSMVLTSVAASHTDLTTGALKISCKFQQITQVQAELVEIPAATVSTGGTGNGQGRNERPAASSEVSAGRKTTGDGSDLAYAVNDGLVQQ